MNISHNGVYSIIVTYRPIMEDLYQQIEALKLQTDYVVVCNNSSYDIGFEDDKVIFFNFRDNLGIAKAQSIGMKWAFKNGANFVLQMDQDSVPDNELVLNLLSSYSELTAQGYKIGLVGSQDYDKDTGVMSKAIIDKSKKIENTNSFIVSNVLSSGSLIPQKIYSLIGGMDDSLFIDIVDFEYCWRVIDNDYLVVKNKDALLGHKLGFGSVKIFLFFTINIGESFRHYYQYRNILTMMNRGYVPLSWKITQLIKLIFKIIIYPIGLKDGKDRFRYMRMGIKDYLGGKKGCILIQKSN
jgi:rhamnosyltransferase